MFWLLPIGVEGATLRRLPWVSIGLAVACALAFLSTWVFARDPEHAGEGELVEAVEYWQEHPYLALPESIEDRLEPSIAKRRPEHRRRSAPTDNAVLRLEQAELDALSQVAETAAEAAPLRRFALVPARGARQVGWLTHLFLHWGWMHLFGNLLFFYLVGPLLEQAWGRGPFLTFYLMGGLFAGLAHCAMDRHSGASMMGASGAIAACIGAFTVRYAGNRIRIGYFVFLLVRLWRGSFSVPAWLWGGFWFASELLNWKASANSGVAVAAHVAGFGFGFALALMLKLTRYGEAEDAHEGEDVVWEQHGGVLDAEAALARGDGAAAEASLCRVLAQEPGNAQALLALGRLELESGRRESGMGRVDRLLRQQLGSPAGEELAFAAIAELGPLFEPALLTPGVALRLGGLLENGPEGLRHLALDAYRSAARTSGPAGAKAHLRAAALRLARRDSLAEIEEHLEAAQAEPGLAAEVQALRVRAGEVAASRSRGIGTGPMSLAPVPPRIVGCRLLGIGADALSLEVEGRPSELKLRRVVAVAVGVVPREEAGGSQILTDLVVSWGGAGQGASVLRLDGPSLGLPAHFPGQSTRQAFGSLLSHVLERSGAKPMFDAGALASFSFPSFKDRAALEAAYYGKGD